MLKICAGAACKDDGSERTRQAEREEQRVGALESVTIVAFRDRVDVQENPYGEVYDESEDTLSPPTYEEFLRDETQSNPPGYDSAVGK